MEERREKKRRFLKSVLEGLGGEGGRQPCLCCAGMQTQSSPTGRSSSGGGGVVGFLSGCLLSIKRTNTSSAARFAPRNEINTAYDNLGLFFFSFFLNQLLVAGFIYDILGSSVIQWIFILLSAVLQT